MKIALGTAQFGLDYGIANCSGQVSTAEAKKIICYAKSEGVITLDTAVAYGNSEEVLGNIGVADFDVITKLPEVPSNCESVEDWINQSVKKSLDNLKVGKLKGLLLHRPAQLLDKQGAEIFKGLMSVKEKGLVERVGVSVYSPYELENYIPNFAIDIVQIPFNIIDRRLFTSGWLDKLNEYSIEVHVRSVLMQGLLVLPPKQRSDYFECWSELWCRYDEWLSDSGLTPLEACLRFISSFSQLDRIVLGVESLTQLQEINDIFKMPPIQAPDNLSSNDERLLNPGMWKK